MNVIDSMDKTRKSDNWWRRPWHQKGTKAFGDWRVGGSERQG